MRFEPSNRSFFVSTEALQLLAKIAKPVKDAASVSFFNYIVFDFDRESLICASESLVCAWVNRAHPTEFIPPTSARCRFLWRPSAIDLLAQATQLSRKRTHAPVVVTEQAARLGCTSVPLLATPNGFTPTFHELIPPIGAYQRTGHAGRTVAASAMWAVVEAMYCLRPPAVQAVKEPLITMLSASACSHDAPTVFVAGDPSGPYCVCAASTVSTVGDDYPNPWVKTIEARRKTTPKEYRTWVDNQAADKLQEMISSARLRGKVS